MKKKTKVTNSGIVVENIGSLFTLESASRKSGRSLSFQDMDILSDSCLVCAQAKIKWVGPRKNLPEKFKKMKKVNAFGGTVIPAFIDSHTHLVFAGDRSGDFEKRLNGVSYEQIGAEGGGILTTMKATREATEAELYRLAAARVQSALEQGITTIEIKTGYGLDFESEKKCLNVISKLKKTSRAEIVATFLAAHALPPEFKGRKSDYIKTVAFEWLPKLSKQIDFIDLFLDKGYFDTDDADVLFNQAQKLKIPVKLHADELALTGGTQTAVKFKALSADHLLKITDREIELLAQSDVTATLLPTTAFFLNTEFAPARKMLDAGVRVALATDFNPGTSPSQDVSLTALLAALKMKMKPHEILAALTLNAAYAVGLQGKKGALLEGYDADFIILDSPSLSHFFYEFGYRKISRRVFIKGQVVPLKKS